MDLPRTLVFSPRANETSQVLAPVAHRRGLITEHLTGWRVPDGFTIGGPAPAPSPNSPPATTPSAVPPPPSNSDPSIGHHPFGGSTAHDSRAHTGSIDVADACGGGHDRADS